jgi:hypothetical protein
MKPKVRVFLLSFLLILPSNGLNGASAAKTFSISESNNGQKIQVLVGTILKITLHSTYWGVSSTSNLKLIGTPQISPITPSQSAPANCQHPGTGCGTVIWSFKAMKRGTAAFSATRTSCGEALRCTSDQILFKVRLNVD